MTVTDTVFWMIVLGAFACGAVIARFAGAAYDNYRLKRGPLRHARANLLSGSASRFLRITRELERQLDDFQSAVADRDVQLDEFRGAYEQRAQELGTLKNDVRAAVAKTRELREELIDRATESAHERARLAQLESRLKEKHH